MRPSSRRSVLTWFGKVMLAGIIAFAVLSALSMFYYNMPPSDVDPTGSTQVKYAPNTPYCYAIEGFGYGRTNNDGRMNTYDYEPGMDIDVLVIGSSHMEALEVKESESTASLLNNLLPDDTVYNIGFSAHNIYVCSTTLDSALDTYRPSKYVVLETDLINLENDLVQQVLDTGDYKAEIRRSKFAAFVRHFRYLRLVKFRLAKYFETPVVGDAKPTDDPVLLNKFLERLSNIASNYGVKLIIAYHPKTSINEDGNLQLSTDEAESDAFADLCEKNDILFLDMSERFKEEYANEYILPHGFNNTSVGGGHLNKYGHRMMAEELYTLLQEEGV